MDLRMLEFAATMFFRMCEQHPELCPHDFHWCLTKGLEDGREEKHYRCSICGKENIVIEEE